MVISRQGHQAAIEGRLRRLPVVALLGARQVGKTTLAREVVRRYPGPSTVFDLERAADVALWGTYSGPELDLLVVRGPLRLGFEFKRTTAPAVTPSMRIALESLHLKRLDVIHAGERTGSLAKGIRAVAIGRLLEDLEPMR